jgi:hypothetical protein
MLAVMLLVSFLEFGCAGHGRRWRMSTRFGWPSITDRSRLASIIEPSRKSACTRATVLAWSLESSVAAAARPRSFTEMGVVFEKQKDG